MKYIRILDGNRVVLEMVVPDEFEIIVSSKKSEIELKTEAENERQGEVVASATPLTVLTTPPTQPAEKPREEPRKPAEKPPSELPHAEEERAVVKEVQSIREKVGGVEDVIGRALEEIEKKGITEAGKEDVLTELMSREIETVEKATEKAEAELRRRAGGSPEDVERERKAKDLLMEIIEYKGSGS